ncbi:MAG: LysR family transcriptional regulator [Mogibacterium sp.]|nr:LysR family transcriptional regulator [Mogibacterium sp.]
MFLDTKTQCFLEAARELNFTRAAEKMFISQPALSKNIASLEEACGMKLFVRDHKKSKLMLTSAGEVLFSELQKIEASCENMLVQAKRAEAGEEGRLTIGLFIGQIINRSAAETVAEMNRRYPHIEIDKVMGSYEQLRQWLTDGTVDSIVTLRDEADKLKDVHTADIYEIPLGFAIPNTNQLSLKKEVFLKDLSDQVIIYPNPKERNTLYNNFRNLCIKEGIEPDIIEAKDINHMNLMGELGRGILVCREDSILTKSPNLTFIKSEELGTVTLSVITRTDNYNPVLQIYHRLFEEISASHSDAEDINNR